MSKKKREAGKNTLVKMNRNWAVGSGRRNCQGFWASEMLRLQWFTSSGSDISVAHAVHFFAQREIFLFLQPGPTGNSAPCIGCTDLASMEAACAIHMTAGAEPAGKADDANFHGENLHGYRAHLVVTGMFSNTQSNLRKEQG